MTADLKFSVRKSKRIDVGYYTSINLAPESSWSKEEERVKITLRDAGEVLTRWFHVVMSRKEAAALGKVLVKYGETLLEGEDLKP